MGKYEKWASIEGRFLAMTGLSQADFDQLRPFFACAHDEYLSRYEMSGKVKKGGRRFVIYRNSPLPNHVEQLCFNSYTIPAEFVLWQDSGYPGYAPEDVLVIQPTKKPKGRELSQEERLENRSISSIRVRMEHFIGLIKRYRMVKDDCWVYKDNFREAIFITCTGLHNFRVMANLPKYRDNQ